MAVKHVIVHQKPNAVFASAEDARNDLQSQYPQAFKDIINAWHTQLLADGIMLAPIEYVWDQAANTISVIRTISDMAEYNQSRPFTREQTEQHQSAAGWTHLTAFVDLV